MEKIKVAVMGGTGIVGQQFIRMLADHPYFEVGMITASRKSINKRYGEAVDWIVSEEVPIQVQDIEILEASLESFKRKGVRVVFSALPAVIAEKIELELVKKGFYVFSNASANRMMPEVPILIPEVNCDHIELISKQTKKWGGFIVTNSNCTTAGLAMLLKPLMIFGLISVNVSTYQALSGAGRRGVASLEILGNIIPYIKNEEEKIETETCKILGRLFNGSVTMCNIDVNASCCRVAVRDGHLESVSLQFNEDISVEMVDEALEKFKGVPQELKLPTAPVQPIIVKEEENRPQPVLDVNNGFPARARGMSVTVGRIRKKRSRINCFILLHNTIRGAAGTCILNAELAYKLGLMNDL